MRKMTKVLAVTALLALGASFTSMAATYDWRVDENGEWVCYDKAGDPYTEAWVESVGKDYYVDEDGYIVKNSWIEGEDGELYYVLSDGAKLTNAWKTLLPYDADEDAEYAEFYFNADGKLQTLKRIAWKGDYYYVDGDGKMLTGWVEYIKGSACEPADDNTAASTLVYCNEDGSRASEIWVNDFDYKYDEEEREELDLDEDDLKWYYIKANGGVQTGRKKDIKGETYFFDETNGQMLTGWVVEATATNATDPSKVDTFYYALGDNQISNASADFSNHITGYTNPTVVDIHYCGSADQGWMKKDRWVETYAPEVVDANIDDDTDTFWYYIDKNGDLVVADNVGSDTYTALNLDNGRDLTGHYAPTTTTDRTAGTCEQFTINKKTYLINDEGQMQYGLMATGSNANVYYYGTKATGDMETGKVVLKDSAEEESFTLFFCTKTTNTEVIGRALTGTEGNYLYNNGVSVKAIDDGVYYLVEVAGKMYLVDENGKVQSSTTKVYELEDVNTTINVNVVANDKVKITAFVNGNTRQKNNFVAGSIAKQQ